MASVSCSFGVDDIARVPEAPTFDQDVQPLLRDHCTLCHGPTPARGAPGDFRLDVYANTGDKLGAATMAPMIVQKVDSNAMPPAAAWGDGIGPNGKALLKRWLEQGAPEK